MDTKNQVGQGQQKLIFDHRGIKACLIKFSFKNETTKYEGKVLAHRNDLLIVASNLLQHMRNFNMTIASIDGGGLVPKKFKDLCLIIQTTSHVLMMNLLL